MACQCTAEYLGIQNAIATAGANNVTAINAQTTQQAADATALRVLITAEGIANRAKQDLIIAQLTEIQSSVTYIAENIRGLMVLNAIVTNDTTRRDLQTVANNEGISLPDVVNTLVERYTGGTP